MGCRAVVETDPLSAPAFFNERHDQPGTHSGVGNRIGLVGSSTAKPASANAWVAKPPSRVPGKQRIVAQVLGTRAAQTQRPQVGRPAHAGAVSYPR